MLQACRDASLVCVLEWVQETPVGDMMRARLSPQTPGSSGEDDYGGVEGMDAGEYVAPTPISAFNFSVGMGTPVSPGSPLHRRDSFTITPRTSIQPTPSKPFFGGGGGSVTGGTVGSGTGPPPVLVGEPGAGAGPGSDLLQVPPGQGRLRQSQQRLRPSFLRRHGSSASATVALGGVGAPPSAGAASGGPPGAAGGVGGTSGGIGGGAPSSRIVMPPRPPGSSPVNTGPNRSQRTLVAATRVAGGVSAGVTGGTGVGAGANSGARPGVGPGGGDGGGARRRSSSDGTGLETPGAGKGASAGGGAPGKMSPRLLHLATSRSRFQAAVVVAEALPLHARASNKEAVREAVPAVGSNHDAGKSGAAAVAPAGRVVKVKQVA